MTERPAIHDMPVSWEFVKAVFPSGGSDSTRIAIGARIQAACAHIADSVDGQQLVDRVYVLSVSPRNGSGGEMNAAG